MLPFTHLPIYVVLLVVDLSLASSTHTLVPRAVHSLHQHAVRHTHSLAQDIRVAFGSILIPRADTIDPNHAVYCKSGGGRGRGNTTTTTSSDGGTGGTLGSPSSSGTPRSPTNTKTTSNPSSTPNVPVSSPWKLVESHAGQNFFDGWDFFQGGDPTEGTVTFVDQNTARSVGILEVNALGNAVMRVETTPVVPTTRQSVRITTQRQLNGGLILMDSVHMPHGCGVWPAFWTNGPTWPITGEIDIVEGIHDNTNNQATVHTDIGCTLASSSSNTLAISGNVIGGTNCAALTTGNQGCGIRASASNTYGAGFNANGGGVYAMKWDTSGVAVFFFPAGSVPADIGAETPLPDTWGAAQARWPATSCDPFKFFINHSAIFDITLCGQWAGAVWNTASAPGQDQTCAQKTGVSTCEAFVRANGASMDEAFWEVKSVKIYQLQG